MTEEALERQLLVFANDIGALYRREQARAQELEGALRTLKTQYLETVRTLARPRSIPASRLLRIAGRANKCAARPQAAEAIFRRCLNRLRYALARDRQYLAGKNAGGVQHLGLREIAEGKLADKIIGAGFLCHLPHLLADGAG